MEAGLDQATPNKGWQSLAEIRPNCRHKTSLEGNNGRLDQGTLDGGASWVAIKPPDKAGGRWVNGSLRDHRLWAFSPMAGDIQPFLLGIFLDLQANQQIHQLVGHAGTRAVHATVTSTPMTWIFTWVRMGSPRPPGWSHSPPHPGTAQIRAGEHPVSTAPRDAAHPCRPEHIQAVIGPRRLRPCARPMDRPPAQQA